MFRTSLLTHTLAASSADETFSGDELFVFIISLGLAVITLYRWYRPLAVQAFDRSLPRRRSVPRLVVLLMPPVLLAGLYGLLRNWADPYTVANDSGYVWLFMLTGAVWLTGAAMISRWLGVGLLDDVLVRHNPAALAAFTGAVAGAVAIYAGCNVGAGPTIWTTLVPAFVATASWVVLWILVETLSGVSDAIAIDRDVAAGLRQGGYLLASGLVLGRAMAGDWTSWAQTFADFIRLGSPAVAIATGVLVLHWFGRPTAQFPNRPRISAGVAPAVAMLLAAVGYVLWLGPPDIGVHVITYEQYMNGVTGSD